MAATLLIVDDSRTVRMLARQVCRQRGWLLFEAIDAAQGLRIASRESIDLVLLDTTLRGLRLSDAIHAFRNLPLTRNTPILLLAPSLGQGNLPLSAKEQAQSVLAKPFSCAALDRTVGQWLFGSAHAPAAALTPAHSPETVDVP